MTRANEDGLWKIGRVGSGVRRWGIFKRGRERDVERVRANELDFAGDLAFCSWCSFYLSPL